MSSARLLRQTITLGNLAGHAKVTPSSVRHLTSASSRQSYFPALRVAHTRIITPVHLRRTYSSNSTSETPVEPPAEAPSPESVDTNAAKANENAKETEKCVEDAKKAGEKQKTVVEKLKEEKEDLMSRLRYLQADLLNAQRIAKVEKEKMKDFAINRFASDLLETVDTLERALKTAKAHDADVVDHSESSSETSSDGTSSGSLSFSSSSSSSSPLSDSSSDGEPSKTSAGEVVSPPTNDSALLEGIKITYRHLLQTLERHHIQPFTSTGETFDPNWHEALFEIPLQVAQNMPDLKKEGGEVKPGIIFDTHRVGYRIKDRCLRAAQVGVVGE